MKALDRTRTIYLCGQTRSCADSENIQRLGETIRIFTLLTLMAAAYFVAHGDQRARCASVIAADGRFWNNVRVDWTIAGDLQVSDATGHRIAMLPEKTTSYSYTNDSWYLGVLLEFSLPR